MPFDGAFSPLHWLVIAVVALLVLGPRELPGMAKKVGRAVHDLRQIQQQLGAELGDLVGGIDGTASATPPADSIEHSVTEDDQRPKETP